MLINRAYKYELEPTAEQATAFAQWAGACRFVYNIALEQRREYGQRHRINYSAQSAELKHLRHEYDWLQAVPFHALQSALRALDTAFHRFFTGLGEFPKSHKKGRRDAFTLPDPAYLDFKRFNRHHGAIKIPKVGWVKFRGYRPIGGKLRSITIAHRAGKWFASVAWRKEAPDSTLSNLPTVGIDRGVAVFAALSTGVMVAPRNAFRGLEAKIANAQRRLERKTKFSANWKKQLAKVSRLHEKAANARKDFLHKLAIDIAKSHGVVKIEKLRVKNMTASASGTVEEPGRNVRQKAGLNKAILDQGWSMFATMLRYKLAERGGRLEEVDPAYTSQGCSCCGAISRKNRKSQSRFECVECGFTANADWNAAINIAQARTIAVEPPKRTLKRVGKRKQQKEAAYAAV